MNRRAGLARRLFVGGCLALLSLGGLASRGLLAHSAPLIEPPSTTSTTSHATTSTSSGTSTPTVPPTTTTLAPSPPPGPPPTPTAVVNEDRSDASPPPQPVPPRATPRARTPADAAIAKTADAQVGSSQGVANAAIADAKAADLALGDLQTKQQSIQRTYDSLQADDARAAERLQHQRSAMRTRAVALYLGGGADPLIPLGADVYDYGRKRVLIDALHEADKRTLASYQAAKAAAGDGVTQLVATLESLNGQLIAARANSEQVAQRAKQALDRTSALQASAQVAINGFVFPVGSPHNFTNTFGAPRMVGTPYYHLHQGNDIFAAHGTPLFACERGFVFKMGTDRLGGTKLWVSGESGTTYYYAHLSAFAAGLTDGRLVEAGDLVGYVGQSGNAASTPPHLHFEIHPSGGAAIDPYTTLKTVDDAVKQFGPNAPASPPPTPPAAVAAGPDPAR